MTDITTQQSELEFAPDPALSFWPTPPEVADDLVHWVLQPWHGLGEGVRVLEPSAGDGHLARGVREHLPEAHITGVEPNPQRAKKLRTDGVVDEVVQATLEDYLAAVALEAFVGEREPFHLVAMNPPFTLDGRPEAWAEHILAIYNDPHLLTSYAVIGAVVPHIVLTGQSRQVRTVRELVRRCGGIEPCERGAFAAVGAKVSAALMWTQKMEVA